MLKTSLFTRSALFYYAVLIQCSQPINLFIQLVSEPECCVLNPALDRKQSVRHRVRHQRCGAAPPEQRGDRLHPAVRPFPV